MFREDMAELFEASAKLDKILSTAAQRRILYFKPQETTTSTANSVTDTIAMRVSFSYLPTLTTSIQVFEVEEPSLSAAQPTMENESVQLSAELAVAVQPAILSKQIQSYLKVFVEKSGLTSSQNFDIVVKGFKAVTTASSFQWLENPIILSTSLIAQLPQSLVPLMLFLFPEHEGLWGARRAKLSELRHQETLLHMRQDDSNNITQHIAKSDDFLVDCVKEFLLTDLLLSFFFKMKAIWFHREWLLKLMIESHLLSDKGGILLPQFGDVQRACFFSSAASVNRGPEIDEKLSPTVKTLDLRTFLTLDDEVLSFASDKHPLNYNAWHYRRARLTLLRCCSHHCRPVRDATNPIYRDLLQPSAESVMRFLETHNADSSACSFLLFLLHQCASDETRDLHGGSNTAGLPYHLRASAAEVPLSVVLWCRLLCFTQRELHRHVDKGHEGMWHLRLGLIRYALSISSKKSSLHHPLLSSWTVADELAWVSVYAEGYHDMSAVSVGSSECDKGLLTPSGDPAKAWVESSGSAAWSSYLATRYGLQLLQSLRLSKTSET